MPGTTLGQAYVQILPSAKGIGSGISAELNKEAGTAGERSGAHLASGLGKKLIAGIGALGIGAAIGKSLQEGAALQQSIGGIETLFGTGGKTIKEFAADAGKSVGEVRGEYDKLKEAENLALKNASQAYKTAGLSANDYMQTVTGFAAALKGSTGSELEAAKAADQAVVDMSDNANKMGTDMESIQNAYQGFAKQNYTMLDNLKLGYGGTKGEMERLLADAEKISGQEYDIDNLADVYSAIHVVQDELGITGTTAKEAATTFEGSFNSMKAAASNLMGNLALGQNVGPAMQALAETAATFLFDNLVPALGNIFQSLPEMIGTFIQVGVPKLSAGVASLVDGISTYLTDNQDNIQQAISSMADAAATFLEQNIPKFLAAAGKLGLALAVSFVKSLPSILRAIDRIAAGVGSGLKRGLGKAFSNAISSVKTKISSTWSKVKEALTKPIDKARTAIDGILGKIEGFFPIKVGKILGGIKLPTFTLKTGSKTFFGKEIKYPTGFTLGWNAKAMGAPYLFQGATIFGAGEAGDEVLYGRRALMSDIEAAVDSGKSGDIIINLNYDASDDATDMLRDVARGVRRYRMAGVF